eukprot:982009-Pelagomonas_calceolata.AAC.2
MLIFFSVASLAPHISSCLCTIFWGGRCETNPGPFAKVPTAEVIRQRTNQWLHSCIDCVHVFRIIQFICAHLAGARLACFCKLKLLDYSKHGVVRGPHCPLIPAKVLPMQ